MRPLFSQFKLNNAEHKGRTSVLKATAYQMGMEIKDERNNRAYAFRDHAEGKGVVFNGVRVPSNSPALFLAKNFDSPRAHAQFLVTSISKFEEKQRKAHRGLNQTSNTDETPIIGRSDLFLLDARLVYDDQGQKRDDWQKNLTYAAEDIVREKFTRRGIPAIFSIHEEENGDKNFHIHVTSFYRPLTPEGWSKDKIRPFGKKAWSAFWADGARIARNVQTRHLKRIGASFTEWGGDRLAMPPKPKANDNNRKDGDNGNDYSTGNIADRYIKLCQNPLHDLQGWMDTQRHGRGAGNYLSARQGASLAANDGLRPVREEVSFRKAAFVTTLPRDTGKTATARFRPAAAAATGGRDPAAAGRAKAAFESVWAKIQLMIDGVMVDRSLNPDQRSAALLTLRQRQAHEANAARQRILDEDKQNAKAQRRARVKSKPPPGPS